MQFSIFIFLAILVVTISRIPDYPNFPTNFYTNMTVRILISNILTIEKGFVAENFDEKLFFQEITIPKGSPFAPNGSVTTTIFNGMLYIIELDGNDVIPKCSCMDLNYTQAGLPFFSQITELKFIGKNSTMVWWHFHLKGTSTDVTFLLYVENTPPNVSSIPVEMDFIGVKPVAFVNSSFEYFKDAYVDKSAFTLPPQCAGVKCGSVELRNKPFVCLF